MRTYPDYPEDFEMPASYPIRRLCAGMILNAYRDSEGRHRVTFPQRVHALAWLASTEASLHFDAIEQDQARALLRSGWRENALEVLHSEYLDSDIFHARLSDDIDVISDALDYLDYLESQNA